MSNRRVKSRKFAEAGKLQVVARKRSIKNSMYINGIKCIKDTKIIHGINSVNGFQGYQENTSYESQGY